MTAEDIYGPRTYQHWRTAHGYDGKFMGREPSYWYYRHTGWYICHGSVPVSLVEYYIP